MKPFFIGDTEILKFDPITQSAEIVFHHYLLRRENYQRIKNDLPRGQFYLTIRTTANDLKIGEKKVRTMIKTFEEMGIITRVYSSTNRHKPSIYQYQATVLNDEIMELQKDTVKKDGGKQMENKLTKKEIELKAKELQSEYQREWRKRNKEKARDNVRKFWERKAVKALLNEEGESNE